MEMPELIITCLGNFTDFSKLKKIAKQSSNGLFQLDEEFSLLENDDRMPEAFEASFDRVNNTMTEKDWTDIEEHTGVVYFVAAELGDDKIKGLESALTLVGELIRANLITAVKSDSSGIAHGLDHWLELSQQLKKADEKQKLQILYTAWIRKPLADEDFYYSCGMHLFGKSDFLVPDDYDNYGIKIFEEAFKLSVLNPSSSNNSSIKLMKHDTEMDIYPSDHPYHNKYGYLKAIKS